jgi:capsular exopolysaccharide synthesis family protein
VNGFSDDRQGGARYLVAVREHWLLVLLITIAALAAAITYANTAEKRYEAEADILVTPIAGDDEVFIGIPLLRESGQSRAVLTVARLIKAPALAEAVRQRLGTDKSRGELLDAIEVTPQEQSNIVTVVGTADNATEAAAIANAFAQQLVDKQTEAFQIELQAVIERSRARLQSIPRAQRALGEGVAIQQRLGQLAALVGAEDPTMNISSEAVPPPSPAWPRPALTVAVALLAGLLLGVGVAVGLELVSPRVKREEELVLEQRLPILTRVPHMSRRVVHGYLRGREPLPGDVKEAYRTLRASLASAGPEGGVPGVILITSAMPGEGKTMTSVNLAVTLAQAGLKVILVDGDLRRPMVGTVVGGGLPKAGLAGLLLGKATPEQALVNAPGHGDELRLLLSSADSASLIDLLRPDRVDRMFTDLKELADVIVVDSPPLTEVSDALALADAADAVLVAIRLGRTRRDKLAELRRMLAQRGIAPAGFIVTTRRRSRGSGYYYQAQEPSRAGPRRLRRLQPTMAGTRSRARAAARRR